MNLLKEGIEKKLAIETNNKKKLVIDNISKNYKVYKIKLDVLYFNEQNDRIATWISEYKTENSIENIDKVDITKYNDLIHGFITESNRALLKKTQKNIEMIGQQEVGVVLYDGRVIDGNRRFTCLRNIEKETGKTQYFEAVILDHSIENNAKQIKMLELMLQHGVDEKVGYNPIDRLVGVYNDVIKNELLTVEEYANSVNMSMSEIRTEIEKAKLMVDFLDFINTPMQFHIAKHLNLNDPLKDSCRMLKSINDKDKKEDLKNILFSQFLMQPEGDKTRYIRKIEKISKQENYVDDFIEEQFSYTEKVVEELEKYPNVTKAEIAKIKDNNELSQNMYNSTEKFLTRTNADITRNLPTELVSKAKMNIEGIDLNIIQKLNSEQKKDFIAKINELNAVVADVLEFIDEK